MSMMRAAAHPAGKDAGEHDVRGRRQQAGPAHPVPVSPMEQTVLQRSPGCACGGGCSRCQSGASSSRYTVNTPGDRYEQEADRVAEQVMRMPDPSLSPAAGSAVASAGPMIQRACASCGGGSSVDADEMEELQAREEPGRVPRVSAGAEGRIDALRGGGEPLADSLRGFFEPRFGRDLGGVRVHTDTRAAESARDVGARAYTIGRDIVFGAGEYAPHTSGGQYLLAHELTHTVQQAGGGMPLRRMEAPAIDARSGIRIARQEDPDAGAPDPDAPSDQALDGGLPPGGAPDAAPDAAPAPEPAPAPAPQPPPAPVLTQNPRRHYEWSQCARFRAGPGTMRTSGFTGTTAGTYISAIDVNINPASTSSLTLSWQNTALSTAPTPIPTTLEFSPGAGNCTTDCSNACNSQQDGSHCTPLSPPVYLVEGYSCSLRSDANAKCVTWFKQSRGVAFHYYNVPSHAASHGCVRMQTAQRGAEWIFDNTLAGITTVTVNRNPADGPGPKCYGPGGLIDRPATAPTGPVGRCAPPPPPRPARPGRGRGRH